MTKAQKAEMLAERDKLRARLKPGQEIICILRHRARSGMFRVIALAVVEDGDLNLISWSAATAMGIKYHRDHEGIPVSGCGMDMGFHLVYNLGYALWSDGFDCVGNNCPSNDHSNGLKRPPECVACDIGRRAIKPDGGVKSCLAHADMYKHHRDGGYALRSRWV